MLHFLCAANRFSQQTLDNSSEHQMCLLVNSHYISRQWTTANVPFVFMRIACCSCTWHWTLASDGYCEPRLSPPVALAVSVCSCRWQMWWWRKAGKRPVTSTSASMTAGPTTSAMPRAACRQTPKGSQEASKNWLTMWVEGNRDGDPQCQNSSLNIKAPGVQIDWESFSMGWRSKMADNNSFYDSFQSLAPYTHGISCNNTHAHRCESSGCSDNQSAKVQCV